jgi:rfaE bifunctional protein nucleotidyltransferase chain/domain
MKKVLVGGCFDIFHYGHLYFLKEAKKLGDYLIVALEPDTTVKKLKGTTRPIHNQDQRKELLESLKFVDEVMILPEDMDDNDYQKLVTDTKPQVIATTKGDKYINKKQKHAKLVKAKVVKIDLVEGYSTTKILRS